MLNGGEESGVKGVRQRGTGVAGKLAFSSFPGVFKNCLGW